VNGKDFQIVYSDTPGIIVPHYKLQESMMKSVNLALIDADIILYITDVIETADKNETILNKLQDIKIPILLVINKIDLSDQEKTIFLIKYWQEKLPNAEIIPLSALEGFNLEKLLNHIIELLPQNPPYFPKDQLTDKSIRFFVSEIIREKLMIYYHKEVPYSAQVEVESFKESEDIIRMRVIIFVSRDSQKGIIIGHKGEAIKKVGTEARKDIEEFLEKKVFLELFVKVSKDWRDKERELKRFGY